jgi:16S rRNA (guanine527-N7)-methyltransferase
MLDEATVRRLLEPFGLDLKDHPMGQLLAYLELLQRWNEKINLTGIRDASVAVSRHFGESLYLSRWVELRGGLLDIGSGAGFPGLCLKIAFPQLRVTLLEPIGKKRAFLKEVARVCGMSEVEVRADRIEDFAAATSGPLYESASARGVGGLDGLIPAAARRLVREGDLFLWLGEAQAGELGGGLGGVVRAQEIEMVGGGRGEIWWGKKKSERPQGVSDDVSRGTVKRSEIL